MGTYSAISSSNRKKTRVLFSILAITFLNISIAQDNTNGLSSSLWSDSNIFRTIPDGSVVEGSTGFGGLQPDYIVDKKHPALKPLWEHVESISSLPEEEKVASIVSFIRDKLLPRRDYNDPKYLELLKKYRDLKREIPLGEYAVAQAGVCREYALLTHLALEDAGIPNRFLYVTDGANEDHAITVIRHKGELVTVDAYETSYSGRKLKDLMQPGGVKPDSYKAPWAKAITQVDSAKLLKLHNFPKVWSSNPSASLPNRSTATTSVNTPPITIKIGPELTFTNEEMLNAKWRMPNGEVSAVREENLKALEKFKELITEHCRKTGCTVENLTHVWSDGWKTPKTKVTYPDGWWFMANLDPSVLEFQTKEMTIKELEQLKSRIENDIFGICKKIGLAPKAGVGGGHIHIDLVSAFPEDGKLLRDFIVDFANHPGLAYGALSRKENGNATPVAKLRSDQKVAFRKVISDFDTGLIVGRDQLAEAIERRVYYHSPAYANPAQKYMAINLTRINNKDIPAKERTVEIRSIRAQQSPEELKQIGEIFENRINFLKNQAVSPQIGSLLVPINETEIVQQYHSYLDGTQLDVKNYQNLLPEEYKKISINMTSSKKCLPPVLQTLDRLLR